MKWNLIYYVISKMLNWLVFRADKFAEWLQANPAIAAAIPGWVWFGGIARDDNQNSQDMPIYMTCRLISDTTNSITKQARVECRLVWSRHSIPAQLMDVFDIINQQIITDRQVTRKMDWFHIIDIKDGTMYWPNYELNRPMMQKDYIIYYLA